MIKINVEFRDAKKFNNLIRYIQSDKAFTTLETEILDIAQNTVDNMKNTIDSERVRDDKGTHKLENAIDWEEIKDTVIAGIKTVEIGIGKISTLNTEAPYWEMINDGGAFVTKNDHVVHFTDSNKGQYPGNEGEFRTFVAGSTHFIQGIDYVGKSLRNLDKELKLTMEKLGEKFISGLGKVSRGGYGYNVGGAR